MLKNSIRTIVCTILTILLVLSFSGCGGGGGDSTPADTTAPVVNYTSPSNGTTNVDINVTISIVFSESMDATTINTSTISMRDYSNNLVSGNVTYSGTTASFSADSALNYSTSYTVTVTTGVQDLAGNALASTYQFSFATGSNPDTTAPTVISTIPTDAAVGIVVSSVISANFSEAMNPATINAATFTLEDSGTNEVSGTVGYASGTATFTPDTALNYNETYTAIITTGAEDLAGNSLASDYIWTFSTETTATITVNKIGTGSGTIASIPAGINCGSDCNETYVAGTDVTLTATPDTGTVFEGFSGGCAGIALTCTMTADQDVTVTSLFNTLTASAAGNQLGLNGLDDVAVFDQANTLPETTLDVSTFTIEAWIFPLADQDMLVVADSAYYVMIKPNPLRVEFAVLTTTGFPAFTSFSGTSSPLQLNQWNHVVGMVDNLTGTMHVAVNGELSTPLIMGSSVYTGFYQLFSVGNSYPSSLGDFPFIGRIDEVRLSSIVRYPSDYSPLSTFTADADTLGLWHFDEAEGSTSFADSSGNYFSLMGLNGAATVLGNREVINYAPTANAGNDKNYLTGTSITLDGTGSSDPNGDTITYSWTLNSRPGGSSAVLFGEATSTPSFTADLDGDYEIGLVVNDGSMPSTEDVVTITAITPGVPAAPLTDTGQTTCYDASGNVINCTGTGQDGEYTSIAMNFTDNTDSTITDNNTGLTWQKCTVGQNNDASCSGSATYGYNWYEASGTYDTVYNPSTTDVCGSLNLGGNTDWRLPYVNELVRLVDYGTYEPAIDTTFFPGTVYGVIQHYRALNTYEGNPDYAWNVRFIYGDRFFTDKIDLSDWSFIRCVSGSMLPELNWLDNSDGTVTDLNTGLMWQQSDDDITRTWEQTLSYCEGLTYATYSDWRLPNIRELGSLVDTTQYQPAINDMYFSDTNNSIYWSSTTNSKTPSNAHGVNFYTGNDSSESKTESYLSRCVRQLHHLCSHGIILLIVLERPVAYIKKVFGYL